MSTQAPSLASSRAVVVAELVDQLIARVKAGESDAVEALLAEHPEHADDLRRLLPAVQMMADLSRSGDARSAHAVSGGAAHKASGDPGAAHEVSGEPGAPGAPVQPLGELGDFRIIREVGRGGMGVVYEAEQVSLGRRVALKVLPYAGALDAKQLQRFKNEAKAAASLKHDHIVQVHAIGCERGVHFYAMEFIDGQTLAEVIAEIKQEQLNHRGPEDTEKKLITAPLSSLCSLCLCGNKSSFFRRAAKLIADAADALEHAHSLGIVHRDVKPGNLLLDADGRVYVSDFGLARFGPDAGLTMSGDILGTLRYMAPEQALAKHGLADHRVDVYGLGATLYELLTGKPAVVGDEKAEIVRRIAFEEPVSPRKLDKHIPVELETITLKCLAKNPAERYATAGELAADLRRFLEDKAIKAKPPSMRQQAGKWIRRHRGAVRAASAVLALAVLALAAFTTVVFEQRNEIAHQRDDIAKALGQAQTNLAIADKQRQRARQAVDDMYTQVAEKWLAGEPKMTELQREFLEKALRFYDDLSNEDGDSQELVVTRAQACHRLAMILGMLERRTESEAAFRRAIACLEDHYGPDKALGLAVCYDDLSVFLAKISGRRPDSAWANQRALDYWERVPASEAARPANRLIWAKALGNQYAALYDLGRKPECEPVYRKGVDLLRGLVAEFPRDPTYHHFLGGMVGNHGTAVCDSGDLIRSCELIEEAIRHEEEALKLDPRGSEYRVGLHNLYSALARRPLWTLKRIPEAVDAARKSLAIAQQLAADFPSVPQYKRAAVRSYRLLGAIMANSGRASAADEFYCQAAAIQDRLLAADPPSTTDRIMASDIRIQLAGARYLAGRNVEAVADYQTGFDLDPRSLEHGNHSFAACAAARAADGLGEGADKLTSVQKTVLRRRALDWLTADVAHAEKNAQTSGGHALLRTALEKLQKDTDFAGVRDPAALAKLPELERVAWQKLWAGVADLVKRTAEAPAAKPPSPSPK